MRTNRIIIGMAVLAGVATLWGCVTDEAENQTSSQSYDDISLRANLTGTRATSELQTNALNTATKVGVFGISGSAAVTNGSNNQYSVVSGGGLKADEKEMKWPSNASSKVDIYAYAPYQSSWADYNKANAFSVATDQSTDAGYLASDLLYAVSKGVSRTGSAVVLNFSHKLARINVTLKKTEAAEHDVTKSTISICGTKTGTTLTPSTGGIGEATGSATDIKIGTEVNITTTGVTTYGVVVPQTVAAGTALVKIECDGKILSAKLSDAVTLEAGKAYNFTATVTSSSEAGLSLGSITLTGWDTGSDIVSTQVQEVEYEYSPASFVALASGQSATYADGTYEWSAATNNLMTILEFPIDGKTLGNFKSLEITTSNLSTDGKWRLGYSTDGSNFTAFSGFPKNEAGTTVIDLTALTIDLSTVKYIKLGGASGNNSVNTGTIKISPSDVVLKGYRVYESNTLWASFGTPGGNATYDTSTNTYTWTGSSNNLMTIFEFSNGELANYATLTFTFSNLVDGPVRMGYYVGSTFTEFGSGYYSAGEKTVDLTALGIDLSTVTKIAFGGRSNAGSCVIKASDVKLTKPSN